MYACQSRMHYPEKFSFINEGEIKTYPKRNWKQCGPTHQILLMILKYELHRKTESSMRKNNYKYIHI